MLERPIWNLKVFLQERPPLNFVQLRSKFSNINGNFSIPRSFQIYFPTVNRILLESVVRNFSIFPTTRFNYAQAIFQLRVRHSDIDQSNRSVRLRSVNWSNGLNPKMTMDQAGGYLGEAQQQQVQYLHDQRDRHAHLEALPSHQQLPK